MNISQRLGFKDLHKSTLVFSEFLICLNIKPFSRLFLYFSTNIFNHFMQYIMSVQAKTIFDTINKVRQNPNIVLNEIKQQLKRFQSNSVYRNKRDIKIRTLSGKVGWQQTVLAIQRQKTKPNLNWNSILERAVQEYKLTVLEDEGVNPFQVIKTICSYEGNISFNINQSDAEQDLIQIVAAMVVGDGDEKKGSRTAIFHPLFKQFACAIRKSGSKIFIYTVYAQSVSQSISNNSPKKEQSKGSSQSQTRSNWSEAPTGKFHNRQQSQAGQSVSSKYKNQQQQINTKQSMIKKGKQLIAELNKIRKQPKQYVHILKSQIDKFKDQKTINTDYGTITTKQGQAPYYDLISQLQSQYPLPTIRQVTGLTVVALEQIAETESLIQCKLPVEQILDKYCSSSEGIRSIKLKDIQGMPISAMLIRLLVGDGDRKRTARKKMLSPICKAIGCAISKDMLVVNIGESAKDISSSVEDYLEKMDSQSVKSSKQEQRQTKSFGNSEQMGSFGKKNETQRIIVKKTSKSHNQKKGTRIYKITEIQILFNDGQMQKTIQEELLY